MTVAVPLPGDTAPGRPSVVITVEPSAGVNVTPHVVGRRTVLEVEGEIDFGSIDGLSAAIDAAVAAGAQELWIDLSRTDFMDSSGVHLLLESRTCMLELNRRFAVVCPEGDVRRLFALAGVDRLLPLYDDRAAAHRGA